MGCGWVFYWLYDLPDFPRLFNPIHRIVYLYRYLPDSSPIGVDFRATLEAVQSWFSRGVAPIYYPPFVTLTFAPLLLLDFPTNYYVFTAISIVGFFLFAFLVPLLIAGTQERPIVLFIFGISIFSYGLQFELERGQFHTLAMLLCISAVYLFHRHPRYRFFAYTLFCMSVQIKIFQRHEVQILDDGFLYDKKQYRSLSAVAREITGTPWNGFRFFEAAIKGCK